MHTVDAIYIIKLMLLIITLLMCFSTDHLFAEQLTAESSITIIFSNPDGLSELGLEETPVVLTVHDIAQVVIPGEPYMPIVSSDSQVGSRLQYSVVKDLQEKRIVVYTNDDIPSGLLFVQVANHDEPFGTGAAGTATGEKLNISRIPQTIIEGIGTCYTGTTAIDGPLLRYTLSDSPVSEYITVHYAMVDEEE